MKRYSRRQILTAAALGVGAGWVMIGNRGEQEAPEVAHHGDDDDLANHIRVMVAPDRADLEKRRGIDNTYDQYVTAGPGAGNITVQMPPKSHIGSGYLPFRMLMPMLQNHPMMMPVTVLGENGERLWSIRPDELQTKYGIIQSAMKEAGFDDTNIILHLHADYDVEVTTDLSRSGDITFDTKILELEPDRLQKLMKEMSDLVKITRTKLKPGQPEKGSGAQRA